MKMMLGLREQFLAGTDIRPSVNDTRPAPAGKTDY